jgi:hypothetical protein
MADSNNADSRIATQVKALGMEVRNLAALVDALAARAKSGDAHKTEDRVSLAARHRTRRYVLARSVRRLASGWQPVVTTPEIPADEQKGNKEAGPKLEKKLKLKKVKRRIQKREGVAAGDGTSDIDEGVVALLGGDPASMAGSTPESDSEKDSQVGKGVTGVNGESVTGARLIAGGVDQLPGELDQFDSKEYEVYKSDQSFSARRFFIEDTEVELVWELVWALRDLVRFRERSYRLLLDVSRKATQLAKDMKMTAYWRNRVIPGSVAVAMQVDDYERNAVLSMSTVAMRQDAEILMSISKARPIGPGSSFGEAVKMGQGMAWIKDSYRSWRYALKGGLSPI